MTYISSLTRGLSVALVCASILCANAEETDRYLRHPLSGGWEETLSPAATDGTGINRRWWREFSDPMLDTLISIGERNNYDVVTAARRIDISRRQLRQTESA
ncbi:MAG: hypothetical protein K2F78_09465, partial [Muribaculaceae bacterium]|nr:hypothetical protein [Muribaculaceae bacterium]